ncbi:MAG: hypothetical protein NTW28_24530, partial [Candidatus Solibacter sp.]|nr:hypothetical protein [Candidatus Solibacter sp.]
MNHPLNFAFDPHRRTRPRDPESDPSAPGEPSLAPITAAEDPAAFLTLRQGVLDRCPSGDALDTFLAESLAVDLWRKQRLAGFQSATLDLEMERQHDELSRQFETVDSDTRHWLAFRQVASDAAFRQAEHAENAAWRRTRLACSAPTSNPNPNRGASVMSTAAVQKPVSDKRLAANRANALKSTGPRTRAGKAKVSRNACRHYLYSRKHLACDETLREAARRIELSLRGVSNPIECVHRADVAFWTALLDDQARLEAQLYDWAAEQNSGNWRRAAHWLYTTQSKLFAALQTRYLSFGHRFDQAQSRYRRFQKLQSESATSSCAGTQPSKVGRTPPSARDPLVPPAAAIAAIVGNVLQAAAAKTPAEQTQFERLQPSKVGRTPPSARDPLVPPAAAIA